MGVRGNKEAVKIDDWVNDTRGSLIGWIDATEDTPPDKNVKAYRMVYSKHSDSNKSVIQKITSGIAKFLFDGFGSTWGFEVTDTIYPESAIDGFPDGKTVHGISKEEGTPEKRVILKNDIDGKRSYMNQVGPESKGNSQRVSELKERVNELEMQLDAEETKSHELEEQVDRDKDSKKQRRRSRFSPDGYGMDRPVEER